MELATTSSASPLFQATLALSFGEILTVAGLLISVVGNVLQWQSARNMRRLLYNGVVAIFNGIGWTPGYAISRQQDASGRASGAPISNPELNAALKEMAEFAASVDRQCRLLHEQVVSLAKSLKIKDDRWQGQFFGLSKGEIDRIMNASKGR